MIPEAILALATMGFRSTELVEQQEAAGQRGLVNAKDRLPIEIRGQGMTRERIEAATGIVLGEAMNLLFQEATLPEGWQIKATDHNMWSDLLDEKGRKRAGIFYKAAFYDERATMHFNLRYLTHSKREGEYGQGSTCTSQVIDTSKGEVLWASAAAEEKDYDTQDKYDREAEAWLNEKFPYHTNPLAYWAN